jgi:LmbE family N-acetylglucosaminyl deacetylase
MKESVPWPSGDRPAEGGSVADVGAPRVLVVEDDADMRRLVVDVLHHLLGAEVVEAADAETGLAHVRADLDLVVTDIDLDPQGSDGLALAARVTARYPLVPVLVLSGHTSFDNAVTALRSGAAEFLAKPVDPRRLADVARTLVDRRRAALAAAAPLKVLAISAHPDDAELGVGATLAQHSRSGHEVTMLVLSGGEVGGVPTSRAGEAAAAAKVLGASLIHRHLPDTAIGEGQPTVGVVESVVKEIRPDIVYLHAAEDTHQDHRAVHRAGLVGSRGVPTVLCFQSPSATVDYRPGRFADVTETIDVKLEALRCHETQAHARYMDPELVLATARYWGRFAGTRYAEPLVVVRDVARSALS